MMQGLHHQQQQLAALLSAALPKDNDPSTSATGPPSSVNGSAPSAAAEQDDSSSRVAATTSLHRAILYPPNSILVAHSASFLAQGLAQLLSDKSYQVRQSAATVYGALCSVLCSVPLPSNGRQNHVVLSGFVDRFMGWALPLVSNIANGTAELALEGLREFLSVGDVASVERYALPVLKACQELLEDERTSLNLLHRLLAVLTLISLNFPRCFHPHFVDIVDLLLGWAMVPDIAESDQRVIMDSFLQFQKHWVNSMQFSLGLLSKFLGDMDVLLQDGGPGTPQQFQRLLALLCCFSTVLQSVASGLLEMNMLEQITEPLCKMVPLLLGCLSLIGRKFGWSKWIEDSWKCMTLLAEILGDQFSAFYPIAVDILFQSLEMVNAQVSGMRKITSFQIHGVLRTNLQLLSLQKLGLLPSSAQKILAFDAPISQLRLHPNHLITGSAAATYIFLLQHVENQVVEKAMNSLIEELVFLKNTVLKKCRVNVGLGDRVTAQKSYSRSELFALIHFDLKVLLTCASDSGCLNMIGQAEFDSLCRDRSEKLSAFIMDELDPFGSPFKSYVELQVAVVTTLQKLAEIEFLSNYSLRKQTAGKSFVGPVPPKLIKNENIKNDHPKYILKHLRNFSVILVKSLKAESPLAIKLVALEWLVKLCKNVIYAYENVKVTHYPCEASGYVESIQTLLFSVLNSASDRETKVRSLVASVIDMLLEAKLVHPSHFSFVSEVVLERLSDPEIEIRSAFIRLLSQVLPITIYVTGMYDYGMMTTWSTRVVGTEEHKLNWKRVFAIKQVPQQLRSQQLVTILSYISQRWKVPLSSWIQRLICSCRSSKDRSLTQLEEVGNTDVQGIWWDIKLDEDILESFCSVNILSGAWWGINEAARYCISSRLRTNLGGPTQTFAALERMLLDVAHVIQLDSDQSDGNLTITSSSYAHLLPMRLLLDFVEALKKNVYNAYEGSTVLPCPSRQSSVFFRANKKVCEEWFSRICEPMMNAGLALQCHDAVVQYCTLRLLELKNSLASVLKDKSRNQVTEVLQNVRGRLQGDVLRVARQMALALCRNREPEALLGLQKWATMVFFPLFDEENQYLIDDQLVENFSWISGLVYQALGQYEKAAAHFIHLLQTEDSLGSMGSEGVQFAIARIIESYSAVSDWKSLDSWLLELQALRSKHAGKSYSGALTTAGNEINSIQSLARFDDGDLQASWAALDLTPKSSSELTLDPKLALQRSEQMLLQAMLFHREGKMDKVPQELMKAKSMLNETLTVLPLDGLAEAAPHVNHLYCIHALEEICNPGGSQSKHFKSLFGSYIEAVQSPINWIKQDCSLWLKVLRVYQNTQPSSTVTLKLCKDLLNLACKQRNLLMANRLNSYLKVHVESCLDRNLHDDIISTLQYQDILLMHAEDKLEDALLNLWSLLRSSIVSSSVVSHSFENVMKAKACLKLSKWLQRNSSDPRLEDVILKLQEDLNVTEMSSMRDDNVEVKVRVDAIIDGLVGIVTELSTRLCPAMGKSWISYASWCYAKANSSLSANNNVPLVSFCFSSAHGSENLHQSLTLTENEQLKLKEIILQLVQRRSTAEVLNEKSEDFDNLLEKENDVNPLFGQIIDIIEAAAQAPGQEDNTGESLSTVLTSKLQKCLSAANVSLHNPLVMSLIGDIVDVWWSLRRRRVFLFGLSAQAFINYLSYSSSNPFDCQLSGLESGMSNKSMSYTLRATLYVLNILLNYGVELKDSLGPALSTVTLLPWQEITPQLLARLSCHPEHLVRKQLESLLVRLAKLSPWSILYPALVDANTQEKETSEELLQILACLKKLYPILVQDAQLIIKELENVTVLWEELWVSTLQDLHADVLRRINLLREEAARIAENPTLSHGEKSKINAAKYSAMMAPVVVVLERRLASTSKKPETPHEMWFHEEYGDQIKAAILNFKTPPASAAALGDVWRPFENIAASLSSYQRKSSVSLADVAPKLAQLSSSEAPMPGLEKQMIVSDSEKNDTSDAKGIVTIASFSDQLTILSTKTKPKKINILGSDGQKYTYLLKGREDLRLDARIMQLLQAVNGFLHSSPATRGQPLGVRYYSVTPISGRAGLIQWVDNVISIYSVFKSWQNRVQQAQLSTSGPGDSKSAVPPPVPRPIDMFYGKIIPALKEKGIRRVISRRDWPHEVKRKVLLDLMEEAPKQLIHQELWCASEGFQSFSSKLKRFSSSVATMSIVGHMLGLGDRHLDNILVDFSSGDILHIDYNVCFDKGQRLKVPEIVPFRLTQTIEAALGLTGIEGAFRANCEAVLGVLKKNKDIILMLLEVFVWDPLVEWTRGDFHDDAAIVGEERKGMELAVSLSLFASRVQEIRVPLQEHHDLLLSVLPAVESALERFVSILNQYEIVSALFHRVEQERSNLVLHETSAKSVVGETSRHSETIRASLETHAREFSQAQAGVMEKAQEATSWIEQHGRILDALRSNTIPEIKAWMRLTDTEESFSLTSAVLLAGVPLTVVPEPTQAQCSEIDREVGLMMDELDHGLSSAVTSLQTYSLALQRILPLNYLTTSPVHGWAQVLQLSSVNTLSTDVLSLSRRKAGELIASLHADRYNSVQNKYDDLSRKVGEYAAEIEKMHERYTELLTSIGPEAESEAKARLLSALMNYFHYSGFERKTDAIAVGSLNLQVLGDARLQRDAEEKKAAVLNILNSAVITLYDDVKQAIINSLGHCTAGYPDNKQESDVGSFINEFEGQLEKCVLVAGLLSELNQHLTGDISTGNDSRNLRSCSQEDNWASIYQTSLLCCKRFVEQMTEVVLPEAMRCLVSFNSEVMDILGTVSQIRGSIDTSLEQLIEVELEKASLVELEQNYFVKVGLITEQQLALEEAAVQSRDHLSWEEAEELATQEEACRAQLDKLHQTWNQKDLRNITLVKKESSTISALLSSEHLLQSLISSEQQVEPLSSKSKSLLSALMQPFSDLESADEALALSDVSISPGSSGISRPSDLIDSGCPTSDLVWRFSTIPSNHAFFIWKVSVVDSFLDSCSHGVASFMDQNLGFDQLVKVVKERIELQLLKHVGYYLKERLAPMLLARLSSEIETLKHVNESANDIPFDPMKTDPGMLTSMQAMLEEYCNAHETVRAAQSAASFMKKHINNLKESLLKVCLEILQVEWMHDIPLNPLKNNRLILHKFLASHDNFFPGILNISRPKMVESIQSSISRISGTLKSLQACEQASVAAEGQLERAMVWACGGPGYNAVSRNSSIPPEFHDHLVRRRQLLWEAREKASEIMKICVSVLEFEASRDGIMMTSEEFYPLGTGSDGRVWQQTYLNVLTKLDITYHSFTRAEQEWKFAQSNMEAASNGLFSASNELNIASVKVKSVSDDLQSTLIAMRDCAHEASVALSAFAGITKGHTTLTTECGSMLEEVLAITEDLHDVHSLGKEAAALHSSLMDDLSKVNAILLPLEALLSKDVAAMTDAMGKERETKTDISPIHGQAIFQSYYSRTKDTCRAIKPLVPSLTFSVKGLYTILTRLARTASLHAGNLHKALEGLGDRQEDKSKENNLSGPDTVGVGDNPVYYGESEVLSERDGEKDGDILDLSELSLQEKDWISPPESVSSTSSDAVVTSTGSSLAGGSNHSDVTDPLLPSSNSIQEEEVSHHLHEKSSSSPSGSTSMQVGSGQEYALRDEISQDKTKEEMDDSSFVSKEISNQAARGSLCFYIGRSKSPMSLQVFKFLYPQGKNAYALSILRRVEMKLDGRDITDQREISIEEQVDFLLKQATSVDNLCNMYEGWTPWI
ncbi:OLC1v1003083C2 [Oldenlandia corymbosa var. corymbosa]|uniref:non-specific serine/threonine protein kinase n=1 Tax=Oldenlandia corymbosa var. corymbosa TaxID=529605 RepID=A0AAV1DC57_OLDCO|nr:OLC1v1003083C2 [Oldenlandia corymbosa var. corymbosa]